MSNRSLAIRSLGFAICCMMVCSASALAQKTFDITVTVLDTKGRPLAGADVGVSFFNPATGTGTGYSAAAKSDASGKAVFTKAPAGMYRTKAVYELDEALKSFRSPMDVSVTLQMPPPKGTTFDVVVRSRQFNAPLAGASVRVTTDGGRAARSGVTEADGRVTFTLPTGRYTFEVSSAGKVVASRPGLVTPRGIVEKPPEESKQMVILY